MIGCSFSLPSYRRRRVLYEPGEGCTRRRKHLRCVITRCSYAAGLHGETAQCGCTAGLHGVVVLRGSSVWLRDWCVVLCRDRYPQGLSTVWRTYTHVIWWSGAEARHERNLRALQKNSCNYRLSQSLKPRVSS